MIHWSRAGAVSAPTALQVRVAHRLPGRVTASAPLPGRALTVDEIAANIRYFTVGQGGPRGRACTALVLSGLDPSTEALSPVLDQARRHGITRVTVHLGHGDRARLVGSSLASRVDAAALTVAGDAEIDDVEALRDGRDVTAVVLLDAATLPILSALTEGLARVRPHRVVLTWPFPGGEAPPSADVIGPLLPAVIARFDAAGVSVGIKGLPACRLGAASDRLWRSANRWYVDAEHQQADALLFFPDVVRFARTDECRFCSGAERCDGAPDAWLRQGLAGRLVAFA